MSAIVGVGIVARGINFRFWKFAIGEACRMYFECAMCRAIRAIRRRGVHELSPLTGILLCFGGGNGVSNEVATISNRVDLLKCVEDVESVVPVGSSSEVSEISRVAEFLA